MKNYCVSLSKFIEAKGNKNIAQAQSKYMRFKFPFYGIMQKPLSEAIKEFYEIHGKVEIENTMSFVQECFSYHYRELWHVGLGILRKNVKKLPDTHLEDFKKIKYDLHLPAKISYSTNTDTLFLISEVEFPDIKEQIITMKNWNHKANIESEGATLMAIIYYYVVDKIGKGNIGYRTFTKEKTVEVLRFAKNYLQTYFGKTNVALGEYQKLVRGDKAIPLPGLPDVISSMDSAPYKNGMVKGRHGESYIQLTKFTKDGPEIESIISYGSSNIPGSKHYDDQMELFTNQKTKKMSLKKEDVYRNAERIYHPF